MVVRTRSISRRRGAAGFAHGWMLLSILLLQLGLAGAMLGQGLAERRAREQELLFIGRQFVAAIASYHAAGSAHGLQRYPASLDELLRDPRAPGVRRHLRRIFVDPMTGTTEWGVQRVGDRIVGVYSLSTRRPLKQAGFGALLTDGAHHSYQQWVFAYQPPAGP